jgi:hypothetical protein
MGFVTIVPVSRTDASRRAVCVCSKLQGERPKNHSAVGRPQNEPCNPDFPLQTGEFCVMHT